MRYLFIACIVLLFSCTPKEQENSVAIKENSAAVAMQNESDWWNERHQSILSKLDSNPELILIGNSIFHTLENKNRKEVWEKQISLISSKLGALKSRKLISSSYTKNLPGIKANVPVI